MWPGTNNNQTVALNGIMRTMLLEQCCLCCMFFLTAPHEVSGDRDIHHNYGYWLTTFQLFLKHVHEGIWHSDSDSSEVSSSSRSRSSTLWSCESCDLLGPHSPPGWVRGALLIFSLDRWWLNHFRVVSLVNAKLLANSPNFCVDGQWSWANSCVRTAYWSSESRLWAPPLCNLVVLVSLRALAFLSSSSSHALKIGYNEVILSSANKRLLNFLIECSDFGNLAP